MAKQTQTPLHIVKRLYEQEMAALEANSRVKNFLSIFAGRRVKERLNALHDPSFRVGQHDGREQPTVVNLFSGGVTPDVSHSQFLAAKPDHDSRSVQGGGGDEARVA